MLGEGRDRGSNSDREKKIKWGDGDVHVCTRHAETREITSEVTELTEMGTIEERLHGGDGVKEAAHTHTRR